MNFNKKYIFHFLIIVLVLLSSCANHDDLAENSGATGDANVSIKISPVSRASGASDVEVINSVRIILLDNNGKVRVNEKKTFSQSSALNFEEKFNIVTQTGMCRIYVLANEESIEDFNIAESNDDIVDKSISELLESFLPGLEGFESFINSIYFKPDPTKPLPMASMYELDIKENQNNIDVYLVNTVTKFDIYFSNYRNSGVTFTSVGIDKIADQNFLMAKIDREYQTKDGLYWIDWMKKVTEETNLHPDLDDTSDSNNLINEKLGWLTNYNLPEGSEHLFVNFIAQENEGETWAIEAATPNAGEMPTPASMHKGPFYYPESKYIPSEETSQLYSLEIEVETLTEGKRTLKRELEYIKTLFRNTHVILHVDLYSGSEDIYAEIIKWGYTGLTYGEIKPE